MKRMKSLRMAFAAVVMGITLSSCLKSEVSDNLTPQLGTIVEVTGWYGTVVLKTLDGYTLSLNAESANKLNALPNLSSIKTAYIYYRYDPNLPANADIETTRTISEVKMEGFASLDARVELVREQGAENDSVGTASIIAVKNLMAANASGPSFSLINDKIIAGVDYYIANLNKAHYLTLVYYFNRPDEGDDLVLNLRYNKNTEYQSGDRTSYSFFRENYYPLFYCRSFDISAALEYYRNNHSGSSPKRIVIQAPVNANNLELVEELTSFSVTYTH